MMRFFVAAAMLAVFGNALPAADAMPSYRVVSEDRADDKITVAVRLAARATEADLIAVAESVRAKKPAKVIVQAVTFYLASAKLSDAPWADVRFEPAPKVTVRGLRFDEERAYRAAAASDPRPLIGVWLTSPPAIPGKLSIWREKGGKSFAEWHLRNGQKSIDALIETVSQRGRRFEIAGSNGGYYLALWSGGLELGDKTQVIAVAERLTVDAPFASAAKVTTTTSEPIKKAAAGIAPGNALPSTVTTEVAPLTAKRNASQRKAPLSKTTANAGSPFPSVFGNN